MTRGVVGTAYEEAMLEVQLHSRRQVQSRSLIVIVGNTADSQER